MTKKIFISYHKSDERIAETFFNKFKEAGYNPFFALRSIKIGENWIERIERELNNSEYFIALLSKYSLQSDMVTEEVKRAKRLSERKIRPMIIFPIRINISEDINYDIAAYLNNIQQRIWKSEEDTEKIFQEILEVINTGRSTQKEGEGEIRITQSEAPVPNAALEIPGGLVPKNSKYYIERKGETLFIKEILRLGSLLRIKAPRQFGKTSLLSRIIDFAKQNGHYVVPISFQQFSDKLLSDLNKLFRQVCYMTTQRIQKKCKINAYWENEYLQDPKIKASAYFEEYLLEETDKPILLAIDEADRIFRYKDTSKEFFSELRFWNEEAKASGIWEKIKLAVAYSTEAHLAIDDLNQSPFNIGLESDFVKEFNINEIKRLSELLNLKLVDRQITEISSVIGGHPYLTHKALYELSTQKYSIEEFLMNAAKEDGPFADHLRRHHWNLIRQPDIAKVMRDIINDEYSEDALICNKLRAAGLIKGATPNVIPTFKLYREYFKNKL